jgi:alkylation response protein AidB-like acyl-CoA dehydrogenase
VPEGAIQVFGGIGYTWEHVAHVYLRRAAVLVALLGPRAASRDVAAHWLRTR